MTGAAATGAGTARALRRRARQRCGYQHIGCALLLMLCEPKRGIRDVLVTTTRTRIDFANAMKHLTESYADADVIRVVLEI